MNLFKKAAISLAATSMALAPVVASAAPAPTLDAARATSTVDGQSALEGSSSWILALLALAAVVGLVLITDGGDDNPTSP
jgi:hypothetical protein